MEPYLIFTIVVLLLAAAGAGVIHYVEWRLYIGMRRERDTALEKLQAVTKDRDGWRNVGERSILAAQLAVGITRRASRAASLVVQTDKP